MILAFLVATGEYLWLQQATRLTPDTVVDDAGMDD